MPFTPFHFGPAACIALPAGKRIDLPVFLLANVAIDLEPFLVMLFFTGAEVHGIFHSFTMGSLIGVLWAIAAYGLRGVFAACMRFFGLAYQTSFLKILMSSILGIWFHVILDAPLYTDVHPFYPLKMNPFFGLVSTPVMYMICVGGFIVAGGMYLFGDFGKDSLPEGGG